MRDARPADDAPAARGGHPSEGTLRAHLDGELAPGARLRTGWHLRRCAACRAARDAQRALDGRVAELVARAAHPVDVEEGWRRLTAVSPGARARGDRGVSWRATWWRAAAVALLVVGLGALGSEAWRALRGVAVAVGPFATDARDACCWDLDGGGRGDDGVFTRTRAGEVVDCVVVYDDVDRTGTLTSSDVVRYVSSARACGVGREASLPRRASELLPEMGRAPPPGGSA